MKCGRCGKESEVLTSRGEDFTALKRVLGLCPMCLSVPTVIEAERMGANYLALSVRGKVALADYRKRKKEVREGIRETVYA